jgi:hypothetical protein
VLAVVVLLAVYRRPTPAGLALGLAAITLVAFTALTTMHERYAYAALVFLAVLLPDRRVLALWLAFGVVFALNLLAAAPPTAELGALLPIGGWLGIIGSVLMTAGTGAVGWLLLRESGGSRTATSEPAAERDEVPVQVMG